MDEIALAADIIIAAETAKFALPEPRVGFAALAAGAHGLKLFPAEMITPVVLKSWRSVLPKSQVLLPVGGVGADNLASYRAAGASGAGFGSSLYKPGMTAQTVAERARHLAQVWQSAA